VFALATEIILKTSIIGHRAKDDGRLGSEDDLSLSFYERKEQGLHTFPLACWGERAVSDVTMLKETTQS
jgi:hypothetical protein